MDEKNKKEIPEEIVLSEDDLDQVVGGTGLRHVKKEQTVDISEDTLSKI